MKEIQLYGGGLDSYFVREYLKSQGRKFESIYFNIDSKYSKQEIETINEINKNSPEPVNESISIHWDFINLKQCEKSDAFIPNRNFLLIMLTQSMYYDCNKIWVGSTKSDRVNDSNEETFDELSNFLSNVHKRIIEISSPFWGMYKTDVIKWFDKRRNSNTKEIAKELLNNTFSCYYPKNEKTKEEYQITNESNPIYTYDTYECMNCPACFRKSVELNSINIFRKFRNLEVIEKYNKEFNNLIIPTPRSDASLEYIKKLNEN